MKDKENIDYNMAEKKINRGKNCLSMKLISWNVCGLGGVRKRRAVRECITKK